MDLVDEEDGVRVVRQLFEHSLQPLLKVTAVFGSGQQGAHVKGVNIGLSKDFRHIVIDDSTCQTFSNRRFSDAGFANQQRVVLAPATQCLDHTFQFQFAPDQGVNAPLRCECIEVDGVVFQRPGVLLGLGLGFAFGFLALFGLRIFGDAV